MKKLYSGLLGLAVASSLALSASAADLYPAPGSYKDAPYPVAMWGGFYGGADVGYGWGASSDQLACGASCGAAGGATFGGVSPAGGLYGIHLGYNWQGFGYSPLVAGIETDIAASSILGQGSDTAGDSYKSRLQALGTVRGRVGYTMDRALVYVTGGLAYGSVDNEAVSSTYVTNSGSIATGYVLGGGLEYKLKPDLSVKAEYLYVNLGKNDPTSPPTYSSLGGTVRDDAYNVVRAGISFWPFHGYEPLK